MSNDNQRKGNSSRPRKAEARKSENEAHWERQKIKGPYAGVQAVYDIEPDFRKHTQGEEVESALRYLSRVTSDPIFEEAAIAMAAYGLLGGGLRQSTKRLLRKTGRTMLDHVALKMKGHTQVEAEETIARLGIPGQSFDTVVRELIRSRKAFEERREEEIGQPRFPDGDTGRHLLVRFLLLWLGVNNEPISSLFGVAFEDDGFAVVPDTRIWRQEIRTGRLCSFGVLPTDDPHGTSRREAWKKLEGFSGRKNP